MLHLRNWYAAPMDATRPDDALLDATEALLIERGIDGISLERVATRVARSRVTLWRQGVTKETLVTGLLQRLSDDFRDAYVPVVTAHGSGRQRLAASLDVLFEIADRHLDLLAVSDEVFHWATERCAFPSGTKGFLWPFIGALELGAADGSLTHAGRTDEAADVIFNTACWGYVHLRKRHLWPRKRARSQITALLLDGLTPTAG
jgi:AcrR family transcriptional regulator